MSSKKSEVVPTLTQKIIGAAVLLITSLAIKTLLIKKLLITVLKGDISHNSHNGVTSHKRHSS